MSDSTGSTDPTTTTPRGSFTADWLERIIWTVIQAGLAVISVEQFDLPEWTVLPITAVLAAVKGLVAKKVISPEKESASTVPGV